MPTLVAISLFRWDINIRESTVLALVGAGGIGLLLESAMSRLAWPEVTLILMANLGHGHSERMGLRRGKKAAYLGKMICIVSLNN